MTPPKACWPYSSPSPEKLLEMARESREGAYAPYSDFKVGAAVLLENGQIVKGCNIENASFGLTICAERVAVFSAVCAKAGKPLAVAVAGEDGTPCIPCGACLQVLSEFSEETLVVLDGAGTPSIFRLADLLPLRFGLEGQDDHAKPR